MRIYILALVFILQIPLVSAKNQLDDSLKYYFEMGTNSFRYDLVQAENYSKKHQRLAIKSKSPYHLQKSNYLFGCIALYKGNTNIATDLYIKCLKSKLFEDEPDFLLRIWNNIALAYSYTDNISRSIESFKQAMSLAEKQKDSSNLAFIKVNLSTLHVKTANIDYALSLLDDAYRYYYSKNDSIKIASTLSNYAFLYSHINNHKLAIDYTFRSMKFIDRNDSYHILTNLVNLATFYLDDMNFVKSNFYVNQYDEYVKKFGLAETYPIYVCQMKIVKGLNYIQLNRDQEAFDLFLSAREDAKSIQDAGLLLDVENSLRDYYAKTNDFHAYNKQNYIINSITDSLNVEKSQITMDELYQIQAEEKHFSELMMQISEAKSSNQKSIKKLQQTYIYVYISLIVIIVLAILLYYNVKFRERLNKIKDQLISSNKQINAKSVELIKTIQMNDKIISSLDDNLKSTLHKMLIQIQILNKEYDRDTIGELEHNIKSTIDFTERILLLSESNPSSIVLTPTKVEVYSVINSMISMYSYIVKDRSISVLNNSIGVFGFVDKNFLNVILRNLFAYILRCIPNGSMVLFKASGEEQGKINLTLSFSLDREDEAFENFKNLDVFNNHDLLACQSICEIENWGFKTEFDSVLDYGIICISFPSYNKHSESTNDIKSKINLRYEQKLFLNPLLSSKFYQLSEIRLMTKSLKINKDPEIQEFLKEVEICMSKGDKKGYEELMKSLL